MKKEKRTKKLIRIIATWVVTGVMAAVFILDICVVFRMNSLISQIEITDEDFSYAYGDDRIHFLNTSNSDCIIIQSNGKFILVDSGEGNNNPRRKTEYKGYEREVISYIKKVCSDENGLVHFDYIIATHMHYDHSGNFVPVINHPDITIGKAFIKEYTGENASKTDSEAWGNIQTYQSIIKALNDKNIPVIHNIPLKLSFGDFELDFFNTVTPEEFKNAGENSNSIGIKVTKGSKTAFLAADFTNSSGFEMTYADEIGDIDLLKMGHHGYYGSSSSDFMRALKPEYAICTNYIGKIYPNVKWNLTVVANSPILSTEQRNGIIATFTDNNEIKLTQNIMS